MPLPASQGRPCRYGFWAGLLRRSLRVIFIAPDLYWEAMALRKRLRTALTVLTLGGCSIPVSMAAGSPVECADWNSKEYFQAATVEDVSACLASGVGPKTVDEHGDTPLHWAAAFNKNPAVIATLLDAGADIKAQGKLGWTPLHSATYFRNNPAVIPLLLDAGAEIEARNEDGETPLHLAARGMFRLNESPAMIAALLDGGADIEARDNDDRTPLHSAAWLNKNPAVIAALLHAGADIEARDRNGQTPLHKGGGVLIRM